MPPVGARLAGDRVIQDIARKAGSYRVEDKREAILKILVTGAAGFIGFHTSKKLLERGDTVVGLDNFNDYYDVSLKEARAALLEDYDDFSMVRIELADRAAMEALFEWIGHMHVEDIAATREHNHLIAGLGAIDFDKVFQTMARLGYDADISLELYPYVDTPDEAGQASRAHLAPIFERAGYAV